LNEIRYNGLLKKLSVVMTTFVNREFTWSKDVADAGAREDERYT